MAGDAAAAGRDDRKRLRDAFQQEVTDAQSRFMPEKLNIAQSKPYELAFSKAQAQSISASNTTALSGLEQEFRLTAHTLTKFILWKKSLPSELPYAGKTPAERKALQRAKEQKLEADASKEQEEAALRAKQLAADGIKKRYECNRDGLIEEAAKSAIATVSSLPQGTMTIEAASKMVICSCLFVLRIASHLYLSLRLRNPRMSMGTELIIFCKQGPLPSTLNS